MPRKRTPDKPSTQTEPQATTSEATPTATATVETPPTTILTDRATIEPASPDTLEQTPSFAERIEQERRKKGRVTPDPFGIAGDYVAGVRLFENRQDRLMAIKFEDKPSQEILELLKEEGYRWNPRDKVWVHPIREETARATRIEGERLFQLIRSIIRQEKGIESGPGIPF